MAVRRRLRDVMLFAAGFAAAGLFTALLLCTPAVDAAKCIFESLAPQTRDGAWGDAKFSIRYKIPDCFMAEGYKVDSVNVVNNQNIRVHYQK